MHVRTVMRKRGGGPCGWSPLHAPDGAGPERGDGGDVGDGVEKAQDRQRRHLGLSDGGDLAHAHCPQQQRVQGAQACFLVCVGMELRERGREGVQ